MRYAWRLAYGCERGAGAIRSCRIRRTRRSSHSDRSELGEPYFRLPPGERGVVPFQVPTGLADGLGLESVPGSLWIPAPLVLSDSSDSTLGSPVPASCDAGLGGHVRL